LALQWARYDVRVNALCPGMFASEMTAALVDVAPGSGARWREMLLDLVAAGHEHPDEHEARREQCEQERGPEELEDEHRVRDTQRLGADDVAGLGTPDVRRGAVVALHDEAVLGIAADDPVDHLRAGHRIAFRHPVRDQLADVVARMLLDEHEIAGVIPRQHALAGNENVGRTAAERLRAQVLGPEEAHEDGERDGRDLVRALQRRAQMSEARQPRNHGEGCATSHS